MRATLHYGLLYRERRATSADRRGNLTRTARAKPSKAIQFSNDTCGGVRNTTRCPRTKNLGPVFQLPSKLLIRSSIRDFPTKSAFSLASVSGLRRPRACFRGTGVWSANWAFGIPTLLKLHRTKTFLSRKGRFRPHPLGKQSGPISMAVPPLREPPRKRDASLAHEMDMQF